jgi:hypothetical protein
VRVMPENGTRVNWHQENGLREALQDPIVLLCTNAALSFFTNLLANLVSNRATKWWQRAKGQLLIQVPSGPERGLYKPWGEPAVEARGKPSATASRLPPMRKPSEYPEPPLEAFPEPIFLEHTDRVVGWGRLSVDDVGLLVSARITDSETRRRIDAGELAGFSFGALIYDSECSICGEQFVDCNHIAGETYGSTDCVARVLGADLAEISVVSSPANPEARVLRVQ